ncbi:MAG: hypothetical protein OXG49_11510 [Chloroflexi bacterium]|nr:hypothetical protein [Chloroflexota bacterium]
MEQERLDELTELRFRQLERLTSALIEGQQDTIRILTEHSKQMNSLAKRMDNVERMLTLALDDLAFIKNHLSSRS